MNRVRNEYIKVLRRYRKTFNCPEYPGTSMYPGLNENCKFENYQGSSDLEASQDTIIFETNRLKKLRK